MTTNLGLFGKDEEQNQFFEQTSSSTVSTLQAVYTNGQLWAALRKTWKAYKISKAQEDHLAMMKYADRIRSLQAKLGLGLSKFSEVGLT